MIAGYLMLSILPVLVRLVGELGWHAAATTVVRFGLGCFLVIFLMTVGRQRVRTENLPVLLLRGLFGGMSVLTYFLAVQRTGAVVGTLLNYTHSIWANLLGLLWVRQYPDRKFWPILALAVVGLWLVIDPSFTHLESGKLWGLLSGILGGAAILCVKQLRKTDNALTILASFSSVGLCCALVTLPFEDMPSEYFGSAVAWLLLVAIAIISFGGQMLFTHGYRETSVALGSLLSLLVPTIASLSGWVFLKEPLTLRYVFGASLVLIACAVFGWFESRWLPSSTVPSTPGKTD